MADFYTTLYGAVPRSATSAGAVSTSNSYAYKGPVAARAGETVTIYGTYTNTTAAQLGANSGDVIHVCGLPIGAKVLYIGIGQSADLDTDNDFTFDLGVTGATTRYGSALTGLQATTPVELDFSDQFADAAISTSGAELLLTRAAGELEAAGTLAFEVKYVIPA